MSPAERLAKLKEAADILGALPSDPINGLGTQEPEYRAYKILTDEIDRIEQRLGDRTARSHSQL